MGDAPTNEAGASGTPSRRTLLKGAGIAAGAVWVAPVVDSFLTPAAAASGSATADLRKTAVGSSNVPIATVCSGGPQTTASRGSVTFVRTESTNTICATVTLSTGTSIVGREVFILQSTNSGCVGGTGAPVGTWAASPAQGPQQFCTSIVGGATFFNVALNVSGGGGNDDYSSLRVSLP